MSNGPGEGFDLGFSPGDPQQDIQQELERVGATLDLLTNRVLTRVNNDIGVANQIVSALHGRLVSGVTEPLSRLVELTDRFSQRLATSLAEQLGSIRMRSDEFLLRSEDLIRTAASAETEPDFTELPPLGFDTEATDEASDVGERPEFEGLSEEFPPPQLEPAEPERLPPGARPPTGFPDRPPAGPGAGEGPKPGQRPPPPTPSPPPTQPQRPQPQPDQPGGIQTPVFDQPVSQPFPQPPIVLQPPPSQFPQVCPTCALVNCVCPTPVAPSAPSEKVDWCAFKSSASGLCYVQRADEPPVNTHDQLIGCAASAAAAAGLTEDVCPPTKRPIAQPSPDDKIRIPLFPGCSVEEVLEWIRLTSLTSEGEGFRTAILTFFWGSVEKFETALKERRRRVEEGGFPDRTIAEFFLGPMETLNKSLIALDQIIQETGCQSESALNNLLLVSIGEIFSILTPVLRDKFLSKPQYALNYECPTQFPTADQAAEAFVLGEIDEKTRDIWIQQNNFCLEPYKRVVQSQERRLEPLTVTSLWLRELWDNERMDREFRRMGFVDKEIPERFRELSKFIPPISDLVRFLVRDVEDTKIVTDFGLDDDFTAKWKGLTADAGKKQGIDDETAKRYWRAHWSIPAPTQLFEMFHRSRGKEPTDPTFTSEAQVKAALQQQDILPFWVPRLIDTTFRRIGRVDLRRIFRLGAITIDDLFKQYQVLGYNNDDASRLVNFSIRDRFDHAKRSPEVRLFERRLISRIELENRLRRRFLTAEEIREIVDDAVRISDSDMMGRCISGIRKRFFSGELSLAEAADALRSIPIEEDHVPSILKSYECELTAQGRQPSVSQLCTFLEEGSITSLDFSNRLIKLGYSSDDAAAFLNNCLGKINERQRREAEKLAKQQTAAIQKAQREAEKTAKQIARQRNTALRNLQKAQRAEDRRAKLVQSIVPKLADFTGTSEEIAGGFAVQLFNRLSAQFLITVDEAAQTVVLAVQRGKPESFDDLNRIADELATVLEQLESFPTDGSVLIERINGRQV